MTERKHYSREECTARRWFTRTEWRTRGLVVRDDAERKGTVWYKGQRKSYDVFSEEAGDRIVLPAREARLKATLELLAISKGEGRTDTEILEKVREIAKGALQYNY